MRSTVLGWVLLGLMVGAAPARAEWPERPIKFIVPFTAGGANDLIARATAESLSKRLQQPVVIENRPGAGTIVGTQVVANAAPDGYTWLIGSAGVLTNSFLHRKLPYTDEQLVPVGMIAVAPSVIVVNPSVPATNLREFIAWTRTQRNGVNWSTAGSGSTPHFVAEMLKEAGVGNLTIVPYKSGSEGVTAVVSGNVSATSEASIVVLPQIRAGRMKPIATTYTRRISAYPAISTATEQGYPMINIGHWAGLFAPAATPQPIVERMSNELLAAVRSREFADTMVPSGIEPVPLTRAEFIKFTLDERARLQALASNANMQAE